MLHQVTFIVYVLANISESVREEVWSHLWLKNPVMHEHVACIVLQTHTQAPSHSHLYTYTYPFLTVS